MRLFGVLLAQLLILSCFLSSSAIHAEDSRFAPRMQRYSTQDGLPSNRVTGVVQDHQGYIWVATERGAVRFDGVAFTAISATAGVPDVGIETLFVDQRDRLWLGVTDHGMCALQADRQSSICFNTHVKPPYKLDKNDIYAIAEFGGRIWLALFEVGLVEVDAATLEVIQIHPLSHPDIVAATSTENAAYFASFSGFVSEISLVNGKPRVSQDVYQANTDIVSLNASNNALWLGLGKGAGVVKVTINIPVTNQNIDQPSVAQPSVAKTKLTRETAFNSIDAQTILTLTVVGNRGFFGSERGLSIYESGQIRSMRATPGAQNTLPEGPLTALLVDTDDGLWIASNASGLAYWDAQSLGRSWLERGEGALPGSRVAGASGAQSGVIWVAMQDSGVVGVFPDATYERLPIEEKGSASGLPTRLTRAVLAQGQGTDELVWIGHQRGLSQYAPSSKRFRHWETNDSGQIVDLIEPNGGGGVWIASRRAELFELDKNFKVLSHSDQELTGGNIEQIGVREHSVLLAGIGGLRELEKASRQSDGPDSLRILRQPITEHVYAFAECANIVWAALDKRLVALDKLSLIERHSLARPVGLASDIGGMACNGETLWFSGPGGLWYVAEGATQAERVLDGISQIELSDYPFQSLDHAFLIGSVNGLLRFDPNLAAPPSGAFPLWLNDQSTGKHLANKIELPWRTPKLAIEAHALNYSAPERMQYQFQLRPGPEAVFNTQRRLDLSGLAPGSYSLIARARNAQGLLVTAPAIDIVLPAPPWQRWYALFALVLLLSGVAAVFGAWLSKRRILRRSRLEGARHTEQLALARTETLGYISHEMRNLLNGVTGNAELLAGSSNPVHQLKLTGRIVQSGRALAQLLDDALDHTKLVVHRLDLNSAPFDLAELLFDAFESQRASALSKGLGFAHDFIDVERTCESDAGRIRQILVNLLSNAIKFTDAGWVHLHSHYRDGELHVRVSDTGPGIAESARAEIFKPYVRLNRGARGSGLGLAISAELARALGGALTLKADAERTDNKAGERKLGSEFELILPLPTIAALPETTQKPMPSLNILVVEDEADNQELIGELLRSAGHQVVVVGDSFGALSAVMGEQFDVVLMDLDLNGSSGLDLAQILATQENMRAVPIIALSGRADLSDRNACINAGMFEHVAKPYRLQLIHAAIRRALKIEG